MPRVGNRKFPYTRQGQKAARRHARNTGQSVDSRKPRRSGPGIAPPRGGTRGRPGIGRPGVGRGGPRMTNRSGARRMPGSGGSRVMSNRPGFKKDRRRSTASALAPAKRSRRGY